MPGETQYVQTRRVLNILHTLLSAGDSLSFEELLGRISLLEKGTSERTLYRDLEFLKREMGYQLKALKSEGYFIDPSERLPITKASMKKFLERCNKASPKS